jgi:hypothetical protein
VVHVEQTWREFKIGIVGLQAASLATNAVLAMMKKLITEFGEDFPDYNGSRDGEGTTHISVMEYLQGNFHNNETEGHAFLDLEKTTGFATMDVRTVMCNAFTRLIHAVFRSEDHELLALDDIVATLYKNLAQLAALSAEHKLVKLYREYGIYRAAAAMSKGGSHLASWIVFTVQVFWDIQNELQEDTVRGPEILRIVGRQIKSNYQHYLDTDCIDKSKDKQKMFAKDMKKLIDAVETMTEGDEGQGFQHFVTAMKKQHGIKLPYETPFDLLDCHSSVCGLATTYILDEFQKLTYDFVGDLGYILAVAHLYNALRQSNSTRDDIVWIDMDWFFARQNSEWLFAGPTTKKKGDYATDCCIALSLNASMYTKDRKPPERGRALDPHPKKRIGVRQLQYASNYSERSVHRAQKQNAKATGGPTEAGRDILAMAEALVEEDSKVDVPPLTTLSAFASAITKDESLPAPPALRFYKISRSTVCSMQHTTTQQIRTQKRKTRTRLLLSYCGI